LIELKNLWVRYQNQDSYTLREINLEIRDKGLYLIVGKTGCGKTTLARTLVGFIPHIFYAEVKGKVEVLGVDPISEGPYALAGKVAYVAQNPELFVTSITVEEELYQPLINLGFKPEGMSERVRQAVKMLGIDDLYDKSTLTLSAGQLQLVSLASAMVTGAEVLILDEPLSRLDPDNYINFVEILKKISVTKTIIVFEHHLDYLIDIADDIIVMSEGRIVARGKVEEVADFLVEINIPDFLEYAIILWKRGCIDRIPRNLDEFLVLIRDAAKHRECVV